MELFHRFKPHTLAVATLLLMCSNSWAANPNQQTEDEWKFTLKNAYINRNFDNDALKDTGSWSQAASLFYKSKMHDTPLQIANKPITIGADASVQYAVRLSSDKHVADTVLPCSSSKIRYFKILSISFWPIAKVSSRPMPKNTSRPCWISPVVSPSTTTLASRTRCIKARIVKANFYN